MVTTYVCPCCQASAKLFDRGTCSPEQFFSSDSSYKIAAGDGNERLPLCTCSRCGHGFTPLEINPALIDTWYEAGEPDTTFLADEESRRFTARTVLERIETLVPNRGRLLDVGSGPGIFVHEAQQRRWQASGLEPSVWAAQYGREHYGVPIETASFSRLQDRSVEPYDVITLFDVIEHVVDPDKLLHEIAGALKPGGLLVLTTPRFDSLLARVMGKRWYCIFPAHLHYFTNKSLKRVLEKNGLSIVAQKSHTRYLSVRYVWNRLISFVSGRKQANLKPRKKRLRVPVNFGDEFEVYAQKKA